MLSPTRRTNTRVMLVDLDGVAADWEEGLLAATQGTPDFHARVRSELTRRDRGWDVSDGLSQSDALRVWNVVSQTGFFSSLPPVDGCRDALDTAEADGWEVIVCSTPPRSHPTAASEKLAWVREHLGERRARDAVLTRRKDLVVGDVLLDDHPNPCAGRARPWRLLVFDRLYNRAAVDAYARVASWPDLAHVLAALPVEDE